MRFSRFFPFVFALGSCLFGEGALHGTIRGELDLEGLLAKGKKVVTATKKIYLEDYPDAHNPSILKVDEGILLIFRYKPDDYHQPWLSLIGVVLLNEQFEPISPVQVLSTRLKYSKTPCQSEDPRIFSYRGRNYVIYNDNIEVFDPTNADRRDMFIVEIYKENNEYKFAKPLKIYHAEKYRYVLWQKNWVPFEWNKTLLLTYTINPHEILCPDLTSGAAYPLYKTAPTFEWDYGTLRGSSPPLLVDGEYLSFFHSGKVMKSPISRGQDRWHYFMGAYTFSAQPPFAITKTTPLPIVGEGFYTEGPHLKKVNFPGGFVVDDQKIYVAYGKDDVEMWIATLDKQELKNVLVPVKAEE